MRKGAIIDFFSKFGFILNLGFGVSLFLSYLSVFIPPDKFWPAAFAGLLYPYLLIINFLFIIYYTFRKSKRLLLSLVIILIGYQHLFNFVQPVPNLKGNTKGLKILTYNVHHFDKDPSKKQPLKPGIIEYLKTANADIICLQEAQINKTGKFSPSGIRDAIPGIKHYQLAHSVSNAGPMTLSKFPIIMLGEIRFEHSANMVLFSDIVIRAKDTIRVYNCHFQSYRISPEDYSITDPERSGTNEQQLREAKLITKKMILAFSIRASQARTVYAHIKKCPYPVIVCGDFNDTPVSYTYHLAGNHLKDAFSDAGFGLSNTYNGILPSFRIDYVLYSPIYRAIYYRCERINLSDHFPVLAILEKAAK